MKRDTTPPKKKAIDIGKSGLQKHTLQSDDYILLKIKHLTSIVFYSHAGLATIKFAIFMPPKPTTLQTIIIICNNKPPRFNVL